MAGLHRMEVAASSDRGGLTDGPRLHLQAGPGLEHRVHHARYTHMAVDGCLHTFEELVRSILPGHMERLRASVAAPYPGRMFGERGQGPKAVARQLGRNTDFPGCYVFVERTRPLYVGISRKVITRVIQHFRGRTHYDASLAYAIAQRRLPTPGQRGQAMAQSEFRREFYEAQKYLKTLEVAFVDIENDLELHLFEVYAAMTLDTSELNTFRTH